MYKIYFNYTCGKFPNMYNCVSAKTLAVAGLAVIGRDRYGVFPLRGKLLNVREATPKQVL